MSRDFFISPNRVYVFSEEAVILSIEVEESEDPVVIMSIEIAEGRLEIMAEVETDDDRGIITATGLHLHGGGFDPNGLGARKLRQIAAALPEELDYDEGEIEGAVRTTGANPGRRPKPYRIKRKRPPAP